MKNRHSPFAHDKSYDIVVAPSGTGKSHICRLHEETLLDLDQDSRIQTIYHHFNDKYGKRWWDVLPVHESQGVMRRKDIAIGAILYHLLFSEWVDRTILTAEAHVVQALQVVAPDLSVGLWTISSSLMTERQILREQDYTARRKENSHPLRTEGQNAMSLEHYERYGWPHTEPHFGHY